jgi:hypothetical protein
MPGHAIEIFGCEITESKAVTNKLIKLNLDSIDGRLILTADGAYPNGATKYHCAVIVSIVQSNRTGIGMSYAYCWPHDPDLERRRSTAR